MAQNISCKWCSYCCNDQLDLLKHSFGAHSVESTFVYQCGIGGCLQQFRSGTTFYSFKAHADRKHPHWRESIKGGSQSYQPSSSMQLTNVIQHHNLDSTSDNEQEQLPPSTDTSSEDYFPMEESPRSSTHAAALFILTLQEKYKLSEKAVNFTVGSVNTIVENVCDSIKG